MKDKSSNHMCTRSNAQSSSTSAFGNICHYSDDVERTPLSNISNVYADNISQSNAFERRKFRKLFLDGRKANMKSGQSNHRNNFSTSNSDRLVANDKEIATGNQMYTNQHQTIRSIGESTTNAGVSKVTSNKMTPSSNNERYTISSHLMQSTNRSNLTNSSLTKLQSGKCKLVNNARNVSRLPVNDLILDEEVDVQCILKDPFKGISEGLSLSDDQVKNLTLFEIEKYLLLNNSSLRTFSSMPFPDSECVSSSNNRLISEELSYDVTNAAIEFQNLLFSLTPEQWGVFDQITSAVECNKGDVFFVYGYGGTGKTFLWKTLSTAIRSKGQIVINVASSGIASLLLTGGRTAHSRFHIPLNINEDSICYIRPNSDDVHLLKQTRLIIWDEAPMTHKHAFEALDRTMNDVVSSDGCINNEISFGSKVIVFGGDFRQILPVVSNGSRQQIVNASLCSSYIWDKCKLLRLSKNMRLSVGSDAMDMQQTNIFAKWLLDIGEGNVGGMNDGKAKVDIPYDLLINDSDNPLSSLIDFVYPSILQNYKNQEFFRERAILAPKNEVVHEINDRLLSVFPGDEREYLSFDSICQTEHFNDSLQESLYSPDFLNSLKISGLPNHRLVLKVGVPVMLLRNIDQQNGLCNGTRLQVVSLGKRVIEAEIISGSNIGTRIFIPRINLIPTDKKIPYKFQRRQFPLSMCFAMTINKSQGQSLSRVGLYLKEPVFTHGQLYVALSRVKTRDGVKLLILDRDGKLLIHLNPRTKTPALEEAANPIRSIRCCFLSVRQIQFQVHKSIQKTNQNEKL
ncbi:hypothetical protein E3N88_25069 [Mikania micrantha]|uniref:ATP-dependent DNA helicase n=1 Tax=Mikania micrantha TaxID=192012 RepID=A0A5N6N6J2_9ASTR|nr:hypothetical protein E3N88_25069 [Mikania micrantha]